MYTILTLRLRMPHICYFLESFSFSRDLEERRMRIAQIYACVLLCFILKAVAFDVLS